MRFQDGVCGEIPQANESDAGRTAVFGGGGKENPVSADPFSPGTVVADYVIRGTVAAGDMGRIFLAERMKDGAKTALKILAKEHSCDAGFIVSFVRLGRLAAKKTFAHAVKVYSVGEADGVFYYAMEYVKGRSFAEILKTESPLPVEYAVSVAEQVAEALAEAWEFGRIVHRSVKPDNILVTEAGEVKIADLGLARDYLDIASRSDEEKLRLIQYAAPETFSDFSLSGLGPESDVYSLGAVLYHAVTGQYPYKGFSVSEIISAQIPQEPVNPSQLRPEIPSSLAGVILKMMARNPKDRFKNASELLEALRRTACVKDGTSADPEPVCAAESGESVTVKLDGQDRAKKLNTAIGEEVSVSGLDDLQRKRESRSQMIVLFILAGLIMSGVVLTLFIRWLVYEPRKSTRATELNIARMKEDAEFRKGKHPPLRRGAPELLCRGIVAFCSNDDFSSAQRFFRDFVRRYPVDPAQKEILQRHFSNARVFFSFCRNGGGNSSGMLFRSARFGLCTVEHVRDSVVTVRTQSGKTEEIPVLSMGYGEYIDYLRGNAVKFGLSASMRSYLACTGDFAAAIRLASDEEERREFEWIAYCYIRSGIVHASPVEIRHLRMLYGSLEPFRKAIGETEDD